MSIFSCAACAVEHAESDRPPPVCGICEDDRQFVPASGQAWATQDELAASGHRAVVEELEPDLYGITVEPEFGIGHRSLLLRTGSGNLLWEPPGFIDDAAVEAVRELGGVAAVSASHPHLTGASIQWSHAFGGAPVLVASADRAWIRRPDPVIALWSGRVDVLPGVVFLQCGGHFAGSSVAHWAAGAEGRGALLTGDTLVIGADRTSVSSMRSYVNRIPLPERAVRRILAALQDVPYDRMYTGFDVMGAGAREATSASLERYIAWVGGHLDDEPGR